MMTQVSIFRTQGTETKALCKGKEIDVAATDLQQKNMSDSAEAVRNSAKHGNTLALGGPAPARTPRNQAIPAIPFVVGRRPSGRRSAKPAAAERLWHCPGQRRKRAGRAGRLRCGTQDRRQRQLVGGGGGRQSVGSLSMDWQGRLYGAHRTERPGMTKPDRASTASAISLLAPERKTIADKWADGSVLTVRPNDLLADGIGGGRISRRVRLLRRSRGHGGGG